MGHGWLEAQARRQDASRIGIMAYTLCCHKWPFVRYAQCQRLKVYQWAKVPGGWWWAVKRSNEAERNRLHSLALHLRGWCLEPFFGTLILACLLERKCTLAMYIIHVPARYINCRNGSQLSTVGGFDGADNLEDLIDIDTQITS